MAKLKSGILVNAADLARFNKKFEELVDLDIEKVPGIFDRAGYSTVKEMKRYAPYDTGRLKRNIDYDVDLSKNRIDIEFVSEAIDPETKVDYAPIQEHGGRFFPPQPYFYSAIRGVAAELYYRMDQMIKSILRDKTKK